MRRRGFSAGPAQRSLAGLVAAVALGTGAAPAQEPPATPPARPPAAPPAVRRLGGERYQIGAIVIDKRARSLTIPGHVTHLGEAPLEYLAVSPHGLKAYESLLEVEAGGSEFNLALILIGLDAALSSRPGYQFDRTLPEGQLLDIAVRFRRDGRERTVAADEALMPDEQRRTVPPALWVYTGSYTNTRVGAPYAADGSGTLIGFVHDPADVVEHRSGLGIGHYGSVRGNALLLPPVGTPVELVVRYAGKATEGVRR